MFNHILGIINQPPSPKVIRDNKNFKHIHSRIKTLYCEVILNWHEFTAIIYVKYGFYEENTCSN